MILLCSKIKMLTDEGILSSFEVILNPNSWSALTGVCVFEFIHAS